MKRRVDIQYWDPHNILKLRFVKKEYCVYISVQWCENFHDCALGDTGKCTHFPYLIFSIIKIISDHVIEKNTFNFSFIFHSDIDFKFSLRHRKPYKFPVS